MKECTYYYTNTGSIITEKEAVKDLGVSISNDCKYHQQINKIVESGIQLTAWVLRTFKSRAQAPMLTLWKSLILSKMEYCSQLWCPLKKSDIQRIENVQRSFLRKISGTSDLSYWERLKQFNMYSLERRRERYRIIYIWKILEGLVPNVGEHVKTVQSERSDRYGRRCHIPTINRTSPAYVQTLKEATLSVHGTKLFNALPKHLRNISHCSVTEFKKELDAYLQHIPDEPQVPGYTAFLQAESNSLVHMIPVAATRLVGQPASRR